MSETNSTTTQTKKENNNPSSGNVSLDHIYKPNLLEFIKHLPKES
jgi:hypothetical protein